MQDFSRARRFVASRLASPSFRYFSSYLAMSTATGAALLGATAAFRHGLTPSPLNPTLLWFSLAAYMAGSSAVQATRIRLTTGAKRYAIRGMGTGIIAGAALTAGLQLDAMSDQAQLAAGAFGVAGTALSLMTLLACIPERIARYKHEHVPEAAIPMATTPSIAEPEFVEASSQPDPVMPPDVKNSPAPNKQPRRTTTTDRCPRRPARIVPIRVAPAYGAMRIR